MEDDKLSAAIREELEEITRRKGHFLSSRQTDDRTSLKIINEFLKKSNGEIEINKNIISSLLLISNYLINDSLNQIIKQVNYKKENFLVLHLYMNLQVSNNFLDGFLLGCSFIKVNNGIDLTKIDKIDILELFKKVYVTRLNNKELDFIKKMDENTGIIEHFEGAYRELFASNSQLLVDLAGEKVDVLIDYLMAAFYDGIILAKMIHENN
ncbi:MAG: hypothetical protein ACLFQV_01230 [Vulcanimicrobiota bacterium]